MDILKNLFYGFPDLWGGGVAHSVMILALVITLGLSLGKLRVKGVSLGLAWILFIGLIFGHYSLNLDEHLLHFLKEFGLILFVYSIGLEVGPGFFASFKNGGKSLNLLSIIVIALSIITTLGIYSISDTSITSSAAGFTKQGIPMRLAIASSSYSSPRRSKMLSATLIPNPRR